MKTRFIIQVVAAVATLILFTFVFPSFTMTIFSNWISICGFMIVWALWILVAQKVFEFAYLDWIVPMMIIISRFFLIFLS